MGVFAGWQAAVLKAIKAPVTSKNVAWLAAWQVTEGGTAANNPLNTTQPAGGASEYNSVGVKNYPTAAIGAAATAQTLLNGRYPSIVAALQSGDPVTYTFSDANQQGTSNNSLVQELKTWGSTGFASQVQGNEIPSVSASTGSSEGNNPASTIADAGVQTGQVVGDALTGWVGQFAKWAKGTFGYALVYVALVMFAIVLAIFGLLGLLGVHPRTVLARGAEAAAA